MRRGRIRKGGSKKIEGSYDYRLARVCLLPVESNVFKLRDQGSSNNY